MKSLMTRLFIIFSILCSVVTAQTDPGTENLTHWWPFDDGTANDQVGAAHGTVIGNAVIANGSLYIESLDQWIELPGDIIGIPDYKAVTVAVWFTPTADANNGYHMVVYFGDSLNGFGSNGFFISPCRGDNVSRAAISCGQITNPWEKENGVNGPETNDGILHHMVVTIDDAELNFYVDGEWMGVAELTGDNALYNISPNYAYIGRGGYTADPVLLSEIHDVRIYNRVLTGDEVAYLYQHFPSAGVQDRGDMAPQAFQLAQN
ncbi:MAG: LamG domain-containing protein, partial [candidate division KSB1 bacterium]|nr:LamG domain-containing protein [candidate division KSB1 bacterium]